ncbi:catalase [Aspergillus heteromorphus CBS 117.55]|uniref:Catalase n=1 Tax=Aspergillus heteromorphus CBS 117.55 TaxID=1448321 RepID=A0A317V4L3_9EURO|nr:catalase [Aspergillus heteromorphus CBS 117.55]PWY67140.1 catalase [Aspergillus heteromorphus CBS 117.55]
MSKPVYTLAEGQPLPDPSVSTTLPTFGGGAITTLGDTLLLETLAHFNRERIPERVVHAKGSGAWGEFRVTNDISHLTCAKFLGGVGKKCQVLFRSSTTGGEKGSADTVRDVRGFAVKFFTEEGNHDIVGNHVPVFFVRDPVRFPSLNRSHKKHPATGRADMNMYWDFHCNQPESVHTLMHVFGSRGTPESVRRMTGFGIHTFKLVGPDGRFRYCKFHFRPVLGSHNMTPDAATRLAGANADFHNQDLADAITRGEYPVWKMYVQIMEPERAETYGRAVFDITKVWPHRDFPLIEVGEMTLNRNPENFFAEIEQAAFSPSNLVPGIAVTPDPMLQARMFAYPDAQRYRLGVNYPQLPPNRPICPVYAPYERDGLATTTRNYGGDPNYVTSTLAPGVRSETVPNVRHTEWLRSGAVLGLNAIPVDDEDFVQPRALWNDVFDEAERRQWVANVTASLEGVLPEIQQATIAMFSRVEPRIGQMMEAKLKGSARL